MKKVIMLVFSLTMIVSMIFGKTENVRADNDGNTCEVGILAVGNYSDWNDLGNLNAPITIKNDIEKAFSNGNAKAWKIGFSCKNNDVKEEMFKGKSLGGKDHKYTDDVDLLFYSGHGLTPGSHGAKDYSFALDYNSSKKYANQTDMYLGNRDLEWMVTFTCNFLKGGVKSVGHMAKGIHCICGYQTGVILTANMGEKMASKLKKGISVKEAFFAVSKETQPWRDILNKRTAAVFTTKSCAADCIWGYGKQGADPKAYSKDSSGYVMYQYNF